MPKVMIQIYISLKTHCMQKFMRDDRQKIQQDNAITEKNVSCPDPAKDNCWK